MSVIQIGVDRELLMLCAERATADNMSTSAWINAALASAIEAAAAGETRSGSTEGKSAVAKPDAQTPSGDHP
jgi:post-segregation antitoxin (ccd killing protein)